MAGYEIFPLTFHPDGTPDTWGLAENNDGVTTRINAEDIYEAADIAALALHFHVQADGKARFLRSVVAGLSLLNDQGKLTATAHNKTGTRRAEAYAAVVQESTGILHLHVGVRRTLDEQLPQQNGRGEIKAIIYTDPHPYTYTIMGTLRDEWVDTPLPSYRSWQFTAADEAAAVDLFREHFPEYEPSTIAIGAATIWPVRQFE